MQQYLTSNRGKTLEKKFGAQIWAKQTKFGPEFFFFFFFFFHLLKIGSLVFLEIAYNDSLQQCLTSSRGKAHEEKFLRPKYGPSKPKLDTKLGFSSFCQNWFISFPRNYVRWYSLE